MPVWRGVDNAEPTERGGCRNVMIVALLRSGQEAEAQQVDERARDDARHAGLAAQGQRQVGDAGLERFLNATYMRPGLLALHREAAGAPDPGHRHRAGALAPPGRADGWEIGVGPEPGASSTFWVRLPLASGDDSTAGQAPV